MTAPAEIDKRGKRLRTCWLQMARAIADAQLSGADRSVLFVVMDHMDDDLVCFPSLGTIAKRAGVDRSTAVRCIARLELRQYIRRHSGNRVQSNRYSLVTDGAPEPADVGEAVGGCAGAPTEADFGRCDYAPRCVGAPTQADEGRRVGAPGGRCMDAPGVGAPTRPEPTQLTYPIEPTQKQTPPSLAALTPVPVDDTTASKPTKPKKPPRRNDGSDDAAAEGWAEFWAAYPRSDGKKAARKVWNRLAPDEALRARMLAALALQRESEGWRKEGGKFIPHATTWLNGERWTDVERKPGAIAQVPRTRREQLEQQLASAKTAHDRLYINCALAALGADGEAINGEFELIPTGPAFVPRDTRGDDEKLAEIQAALERQRQRKAATVHHQPSTETTT